MLFMSIKAQHFNWANAMSGTVVEPLDMDVDPFGNSVVCGLFRDSINAMVGSDSAIVTNLFGIGCVSFFCHECIGSSME